MIYGLPSIKRLTVILYTALVLTLSVISPIKTTLALPNADPAKTSLPDEPAVTGDVLLHNDFMDGNARHVYVENASTGEVMVRVLINQYFQLGSNVIFGADLQNAESWTPYIFGASDTDGYYALSMTGETKNYLRGKDSDSGDYEDYEPGSYIPGYEIGETLHASPVITMTEYIENIDVYSDAEADACWVADSDGWCYWSKPLIPRDATNLLLEGVEFNPQNADDKYCLTLDIIMEAQTTDIINYDNSSREAMILVATATNDSAKLTELGINN